MKQLLLMRHAKSEWNIHDGNDLDRNISKIGIEKTKRIGEFIGQKKIIIDKILCSPSLRTRKTKDLLIKYLNPKPKVVMKTDLYHEAGCKIFDIVLNERNSNVLFVISHEPLLSSSVFDFSEEYDNKYFRNATSEFSTSSIIFFKFDVERWSQINKKNSKLIFFLRPNDI
tara:strand:- start:87 stop:596 length:510 start_codon:yes stop_codon:yes gene_type:complete